MHGEPVVVSVRKAIAVPREVLGRYVGTYQFPGYRMAMTLEGTHLMARFDDGAAIVIFPESETKFFSKAWDMQFEFFDNEKGELARVSRPDIQGTKQ